jgi:hypothetical protein
VIGCSDRAPGIPHADRSVALTRRFVLDRELSKRSDTDYDDSLRLPVPPQALKEHRPLPIETNGPTNGSDASETEELGTVPDVNRLSYQDLIT